MIQPETWIGRKDYFEWRRAKVNSRWWTDADGVVHIPLRAGKEALIEKADELLARRFTWRLRGNHGRIDKCYAEASSLENEQLCIGQKASISLHRLIMGFPAGKHVDHINGNSLDCRRSNLRPATPSQNASNRKYQNRHGYRGVKVLKNVKSNPYSVQCQHGGRNRYLGVYPSMELAALAYNFYAAQVFGEFAILNKVEACA